MISSTVIAPRVVAKPHRPGHWARSETSSPLMSRRRLQVALGWLWILDAMLQLQPANFARSYPLSDLVQSVMGAPGWENRLIYTVVDPFVSHWPWWNLSAALIEGLIGLALVSGRKVRRALAISALWSAVVWLSGEGLGMVPTGFAMLLFGAPGAVVLYPVVGALAWPRGGRQTVSQRAWSGAWAGLWFGGALLQIPIVYPIGEMFRANFAEALTGEPGWLRGFSGAFGQVLVNHPLVWGVGLGALEILIGLGGILDGRHRRGWLLLAIAVLVVFWGAGQEFGGVFSGSATDIGTAPLVIVLALAAWPLDNTKRSWRVRYLEPIPTSP